MPDKKPTDNEIIKALECCGDTSLGHCENCPFNDGMGFVCIIDKSQLALDLINRLQAENEALTKDKENLAYSLANAVGQKMTAKAEAYKELAEKLEKRFLFCGMHSNGEIKEIIKIVLKELMGGAE
jgi:hypothetical protein